MLILIIVNYLIRSGKLKTIQKFFKPRIQFIGALFGKISILLFLSFNPINVSAIEKNSDSKKENIVFPVPKGIENQLFYLQRDPDENTVIYQLNLKNGILDNKDPISIFWIRYAEDGEVKSLSLLQKNLAYGIKSRQIEKEVYELKLVSYPKMPLYLIKNSTDNQYYVYAKLKEKQIVLNKVFVRIDGGSFYKPNVVYIELKGKEEKTGKNLTHRIYI